MSTTLSVAGSITDVARPASAVRLPLHANFLLVAQRRRGLLRKLSRRRLKRRVFYSVVYLQAAINCFVTETNADPKPFTWTADPDRIIAAVRRGHQVLDCFHQTLTSFYSIAPIDIRTDGPNSLVTGSDNAVECPIPEKQLMEERGSCVDRDQHKKRRFS